MYGQSKESGPTVTFEFYTAGTCSSVSSFRCHVAPGEELSLPLLGFYAIAPPRGHWKIEAQKFFIESVVDPREWVTGKTGTSRAIRNCGKIGCRIVKERIEGKERSEERGENCAKLRTQQWRPRNQDRTHVSSYYSLFLPLPRETTLESPLFVVRLKQNWKDAWYLPIDSIQAANNS